MICNAAVCGRLRAQVVGVGVALVVLVLVGCGGRGVRYPDGPTATVPRETTTTDPYAVPDVIDEAYVNRVLAGLDHLSGDAVRLAFSTNSVPPEVLTMFDALYVGEFRQIHITALQEDLFRRELGLPGYKVVPGDAHTDVRTLITARPSCIFAEISRDLSNVSDAHDPRLDRQWVALIPLDPVLDPSHYNRTSWIYIYNGFEESLSQPEDPCERYP